MPKNKKKKKKRRTDAEGDVTAEMHAEQMAELRCKALKEREWRLRMASIQKMWKTPKRERVEAAAKRADVHRERLEVAAKNQGVLTKAQRRRAREEERIALQQAAIQERRHKHDTEKLDEAGLQALRLRRARDLDREERQGRDWFTRTSEKGIEILSELSGWRIDRRLGRNAASRRDRAAAKAAHTERLDLPDLQYEDSNAASRRRLGARAVHSFIARPRTAAASLARPRTAAAVNVRATGALLSRPRTALTTPAAKTTRPGSRGGAWAAEWAVPTNAMVTDPLVKAWPPRPSTVSAHAARRRDHTVRYTKALLVARNEGNLTPLPALSPKESGIGGAASFRSRGTAPRWAASTIVLSNDTLSPWVLGEGGGGGGGGSGSAARAISDAAVAAASARPSFDALRQRRRAQTANAAARRKPQLHPDLANTRRGLPTALVVVHGGCEARNAGARQAAVRKRRKKRGSQRPSTASVASFSSSRSNRSGRSGRSSNPQRSGRTKKHGDGNSDTLMFGLPRREGALLRRGRWGAFVVQLVSFDNAAMVQLIHSLDFLALVKSKRVAIDASYNASIDSYGAGLLFRVLFKMRPLTELRLSATQLGDDGVTVLCRALAASGPNLEVLGLNQCKIGDDGASELAHAMASNALPQLKQLHLSENQIAMRGGCALARFCTLCPSLQSIALSRNPFGSEIAEGKEPTCDFPFPAAIRF